MRNKQSRYFESQYVSSFAIFATVIASLSIIGNLQLIYASTGDGSEMKDSEKGMMSKEGMMMNPEERMMMDNKTGMAMMMDPEKGMMMMINNQSGMMVTMNAEGKMENMSGMMIGMDPETGKPMIGNKESGEMMKPEEMSK